MTFSDTPIIAMSSIVFATLLAAMPPRSIVFNGHELHGANRHLTWGAFSVFEAALFGAGMTAASLIVGEISDSVIAKMFSAPLGMGFVFAANKAIGLNFPFV